MGLAISPTPSCFSDILPSPRGRGDGSEGLKFYMIKLWGDHIYFYRYSLQLFLFSPVLQFRDVFHR